MRWVKFFTDDLEKNGMAVGIERFGTGFTHNVLALWSQLGRGDGFDLQPILLNHDSVRLLAAKFRVTPEQAMERIEFMSEWGFCELKPYKPAKRSKLQRQATKSFAQGITTARQGVTDDTSSIATDRHSVADDRHRLAFVVTSRELQRRRDEWSKRKLREAKQIDKGSTPESLRQNTGAPHVELRPKKQSQESESGQDPNPNKNPNPDEDGSHDGVGTTSDELDRVDLSGRTTNCIRKAKSLWQYTGVDKKRIPAHSLLEYGFEEKFQRWSTNYMADDSHFEDDDGNKICDCSPRGFLEFVMQECEEQGIRYPRQILARKTQLDRENGRPPRKARGEETS